MSQPPLFDIPFWTVSDLTRYLRDIFESDPSLQDLWVQGEISNLSRPSSGHMYFTLKDRSSALRCVMWRNNASRMLFAPQDGQAVEVHGGLNIYEAAGQYQLYADLIRPLGEGALYQEFLRLKARLEAEGLFDPERKRPIPAWPRRIGIVTSPTGAALHDILNTLQRRYPLAEVILAPSAVQGEEAPPGLVAAIAALNQTANPDVILVARGGGSIEDLWAFNDERLARAIAASPAPVISGVGHETDFTIADFVSDLRAPTPTAAAEMATPNRFELQASLVEAIQRLERAAQANLSSHHWKFGLLKNRLALHSPLEQVRSDRQRLDDLAHRSELIVNHHVQIHRTRLNGLKANLLTLNPCSILQRGYAVVSTSTGQLVRSISQVQSGSNIQVQVSDGEFAARVQSDFLPQPGSPLE